MKKVSIMLLSLLFLTVAILVGCSNKPVVGPTVAPEDSQAPVESETPAESQAPEESKAPEKMVYKQSPFLEGKGLPPVEERLPKEPKITNEMPDELLDYEIGTYGGTIRSANSSIDYNPNLFVMNNEPMINTPGILGEEITPNIVKGFEVTPDQKEFTFYMREGLKWSDGQPVTTEDVRFAVEDVLYNEKLTPGIPAWLRSGGTASGTPVALEVIDDFTFKLKFDEPYGGFLVRLAIQGWRGYTDLLKPAHFLKDYHEKYADADELKEKTKEAGFNEEEWWNLFNDKDILNNELVSSKAIGFPVLYPWMAVNKTETSVEFERNPYYFKVDPEGNQLPYVDKLVNNLVENMEVVTMKILTGEIDFAYGMLTSMPKIPLYKENEDKGGYNIYMTKYHTTPTDIHLNLTYEDPVWREVVQDIRFRKALNMAIDREEIIDAVYYGFGEPGKIIDSTFNLEEANKLLDEMGMTKGSDGFRVGPDGKKFTIPFEIGGQVVDMAPVTELVVEQWRALDLDVTMKSIDAALWSTRNSANELQATIMFTHTPLWYQGDFGQQLWGPLWNLYNTSGGKQGEEPPADVQKLYDLIANSSVASPDEGRQMIEEVKSEIGKNIWYFIWAENVRQPFIAKKNLGNMSDKGFSIACGFSGEQFFFRE